MADPPRVGGYAPPPPRSSGRATEFSAGPGDPPPPASAQIERQADVILGEAERPRRAGADIVQLGELHLVLEGILSVEAVQQAGHPPGEALRLPDAPQRGGGIGIQQRRAPAAVE